MNRRKRELAILKKPAIRSLWFWILLLCVISAFMFALVYIATVFQNKYEDILQAFNDIVFASIVGIPIGLVLLIFAFVFLTAFKRISIKDFFAFYSYLNSLRNPSKLILPKDKRFEDLYSAKKPLTKEEYISFVATLLEYMPNSIDYKNLVNEIDADFAKHGFLNPNFGMQKKKAIIKAIVFNLIIPFIIVGALIGVLILYNFDHYELRAFTRINVVLINIILTLNISIFIYEMYIIRKVRNYESFNDFYFLSFNNYEFKYLNSSLIKRK
ncbi:hypothetical protein [Metamycoplasma buccale]|uniref:hypothetical protein n=1 Tax=Metamycoplasma buccale TaxID=55602 RepID=UPI00398F1FB4